jgi:hypothetical protein
MSRHQNRVEEIAITDREVDQCASLLDAFRAARDDTTARDDHDIRIAARAIAHAGGAVPVTGQVSLEGGEVASEKAWSWLAACARAAAARGDDILPVRAAMFALEWTNEIAPGSTIADFGDMGLLQTPPLVLITILATSVVSAGNLSPDNTVWNFQGERVVAGMAEGVHARFLAELDPGGESIEEARTVTVARGSFDQTRASGLPADIVARMAEYGRASWNLEYEIFDTGPFDDELGRLGPDAQYAWVADLGKEVLPVGGWAVYGAAETVMKTMGHPVGHPAYCEILDASLEFQRDAGVWDSQLSPNERTYWQLRHPGEIWLARREPPSRETASITPLAIGDERKLGAVTRRADSNAIYVHHPAHERYAWLLDYPDSSSVTGGRLREERDTFGDLYELYLALGQSSPLPGLWVHPEFEPFLPFPAPRL